MPIVDFAPARHFGVELEWGNRLELEELEDIIRATGESVLVEDYHHNSNNQSWICKPDESCGCETVSPVLGDGESSVTTIRDLEILRAVHGKLLEGGADINDRCGVHVHLHLHEFSNPRMRKLARCWIKMEKFILDLIPQRRRESSYCTPISSMFLSGRNYTRTEFGPMLRRLRGSLNVQHWQSQKTLEFRQLEQTSCSGSIVNWTTLLLHFVDTFHSFPNPRALDWYSVEQAMTLLRLNEPTENLHPRLVELKAWILHRLRAFANMRDAQTVRQWADSELSTLKLEVSSCPN